MKMEIKEMFLNNYKGIQEMSATFGQTTLVSGHNAVGKTTTMDAYFDVVTGKLSDGTDPDKKVRPHDENGKDIDYCDVVRRVSVYIDDTLHTLEKTTKQKWVKPRGSMEPVFKGNDTSYRIDGFDKKSKEFDAWVNENIAPLDVIKVCSNATPFLTAIKKNTAEGRKIIEKMAGFSTEDFIKENPDQYKMIGEITKGNSIDDTLKMLRRKRNDGMKTLETIQSQLDYASGHGPEKIDIYAYESKKLGYQEQMKLLDEEEKNLDSIADFYGEKQAEIAELKQKLFNMNKDANAENESKKVELKNLIDSEKSEISNIKRKIEYYDDRIKSEMNMKGINDKRRQELVISWKEENARQYSESETCMYCGQKLPDELINDSKEKFERYKQEKLNRIYKEGCAKKDAIKASETTIKGFQEEVVKLNYLVDEHEKQLADYKSQLAELPQLVDISNNEEYVKLQSMISAKETAISSIDNGREKRRENRMQKNEIMRQISMIDAEVSAYNNSIAKYERELQRLNDNVRQEAQNVASYERQIDLILNFSIQKNKALADKVNPYFDTFSFRFLEFTQEGNPVETCRLIDKKTGTDYFSGLNHGASIVLEADLVKGFQKMKNLQMPIWIDDTESVDETNIPHFDNQLVLLRRTDEQRLNVEVI